MLHTLHKYIIRYGFFERVPEAWQCTNNTRTKGTSTWTTPMVVCRTCSCTIKVVSTNLNDVFFQNQAVTPVSDRFCIVLLSLPFTFEYLSSKTCLLSICQQVGDTYTVYDILGSSCDQASTTNQIHHRGFGYTACYVAGYAYV